MITTNTPAGAAHVVDTSVEPWQVPGGQDPNWPPRPHRALPVFMFAPGAVEVHKRPPLWKRALAALGVRL